MSVAYQLIKFFEKLERRKFSSFYENFKQNEFSSLKDLKALQLEKLKKLVQHAYESVPFYKEKFNKIGFDPDDIKSTDDIKLLPFLTKEDLKERHSDLISTRYDRQNLIENSSSGSTGVPTKFLLTKEQRDALAGVSFKAYQMTGWNFLDKTILLTRSPADIGVHKHFKAKLKSFLIRQTYMSAFNLTEEKLHDICSYIKRTKPKVMFGYVSALFLLSQYLENNNFNISIPIIIQSAEMVYPHQIEYIEHFLGGRFFKLYGSREAIAAGVECQERAGLHVNMDTLLVEILYNNQDAYEEDGEIVITDLYSYGMPLIRYKLGDVGRFKKEHCTCGRHMPLFEITQGRTTNVISTSDGIFTSGIILNIPFREITSKIKNYQVYQPDISRIIVKIIKESGYEDHDESYLERKLRERLGNKIHIVFEYPDDIPTEVSGKYQFIKSDVPVTFGNK